MAITTKTVSVIGSLNIDFITRTSRIPAAGETLSALSFDTGFGGKGANQAVGETFHRGPPNEHVLTCVHVAAARLAGEDVNVHMVGQVGDDSFGNDYFEALQKEGIDSSGVRKLKGGKTGVTNIIVEEESGKSDPSLDSQAATNDSRREPHYVRRQRQLRLPLHTRLQLGPHLRGPDRRLPARIATRRSPPQHVTRPRKWQTCNP